MGLAALFDPGQPMSITELINPQVHDARAVRRAGPDLLGLALMDARNRSLAWLAALDGLALDVAAPSVQHELDPPNWLVGHTAWFQELWIARNVQRGRGEAADPKGPRLPSVQRRADTWFDPQSSTRERRWADAGPDQDGLRSYLAQTLDTTLDLLEKAPASPNGLHFFRLALHCEDRCAEQLAMLAQALDLPTDQYPEFWQPLPVRVRRDPVWLPGQCIRLGNDEPGAWRPVAEDGRIEESVPAFEIDAQPVCWAQWAEFAADGGYDQRSCWSDAGWDWIETTGRRAPRYVEQQSAGVLAWRQGRLQMMPAAQAALHLAWYEAQAWCRWAGRRLPHEAEWVLAQRNASARGFAWGDALEWVADRAAAWPGQRPAPGEQADVPQPGQRVQRGASFAASPRLRHPSARRFAAATADAAFCGFRSCAV